MSWLIGTLLVLGGVVIGFFISRQFPVILEDNKLKDELQKVKLETQDYQSDVDNYVSDVQYNLNKLESQFSEIKQQLVNTPKRHTQAIDNLTGTAPFFGNEAFAHLRATGHKDQREKSVPQAPPLDYSDQSSGLFVGNEEKAPVEASKAD